VTKNIIDKLHVRTINALMAFNLIFISILSQRK